MQLIHLVYGEDLFLLNRKVKQLTEQLKPVSAEDFNLSKFTIGTVPFESILETADQLPVFSEYRLLVIQGIDQLTEKELLQLSPYLQADRNQSTNRFILSAEKLDRRKKLIKLIIDQAQSYECKRPFENQIPEWIRRLAKEKGLEMGAESVQIFHSRVGNFLEDVDSELNKLQLYLGDTKKVSLEDIEAVISVTRVTSVFELCNSIAQQDVPGSLVALANLLGHGQNEIMILAMISRHFRILSRLKEAGKQTRDKTALARNVGVHPFFLDEYLQQSSRWTFGQLEQMTELLVQTDLALKSSNVLGYVWLENFILKSVRLAADQTHYDSLKI